MLLVVADKAQIEHQGTQNTEDESRKLMSGHLPKTSTLQGISGLTLLDPPRALRVRAQFGDVLQKAY